MPRVPEMIVDLFEFARQSGTATGTVPVATMTRIETPHRDGQFAWTARGSMLGRHGNPRLDLGIDGAVTLDCQRCLQPLVLPVRLSTKLLVASDEDAADALDQDDDYDVVIGSTAFDIDALVEDEVILALPSAPRHTVCPDRSAALASATDKPSPFAVLAALKRPDRADGD